MLFHMVMMYSDCIGNDGTSIIGQWTLLELFLCVFTVMLSEFCILIYPLSSCVFGLEKRVVCVANDRIRSVKR